MHTLTDNLGEGQAYEVIKAAFDSMDLDEMEEICNYMKDQILSKQIEKEVKEQLRKEAKKQMLQQKKKDKKKAGTEGESAKKRVKVESEVE